MSLNAVRDALVELLTSATSAFSNVAGNLQSGRRTPDEVLERLDDLGVGLSNLSRRLREALEQQQTADVELSEIALGLQKQTDDIQGMRDGP